MAAIPLVDMSTKKELYSELKLYLERLAAHGALTPPKAIKTGLSSIYPNEIISAMSDALKKVLFEMLR